MCSNSTSGAPSYLACALVFTVHLPMCRAAGKLFGKENAASVVTVTFIACWYALNIGFNLCNKSLLVVFKFPWFVSAIHVVVGALYCVLAYLVGARAASFERPITKDEFMKILGPASMHAIGHVAANLSFAAVAISLTHTIKTLEPAFNVILGKLILGTVTPLPVMAALLPIMVRTLSLPLSSLRAWPACSIRCGLLGFWLSGASNCDGAACLSTCVKPARSWGRVQQYRLLFMLCKPRAHRQCSCSQCAEMAACARRWVSRWRPQQSCRSTGSDSSRR